jgi:hypothetical protein
MMREAHVLEGDRTVHSATINSSQFGSRTQAQQTLLHLQSLRDHLPPWLGGKPLQPQPLVPMLKALKAATESYLETTVSAAEIVVPFPATEGYLKAVRSACSSISLRMPMSAQPPAGILAARANGIGRKHCQDDGDDDPPQLILTVEYSRAALTALIVHEECGVFEYRRVLHDTNLGLDQLRGGSESNREKLETSLRELVHLPMSDGGNGEELKYINNLVLLGESAGDSQLNHALKKVISEEDGRRVGQGGPDAIDPLFAASRGVAFDCWDRLNFEDGESNRASPT